MQDEMIRKTEYRSKLEDLDKDKGIVKVAINAIGNVDKQGDRSEPGSFKKTLQELGKVFHYLNHQTDQLIGVPIKGEENGRYAIITSKLNIEKPLGRDVYSDYKLFAEQGKTLWHSIGAFPIKYEFEGSSGNPIRSVKEWRLKEFSTLTKWPANDDTPLLDIKSMDSNDLHKVLKNANEYLQAISQKGYHTEEYIRSIEAQVKELNQTIEAIRNTHHNPEPQALHSEQLKNFIHNLNFD